MLGFFDKFYDYCYYHVLIEKLKLFSSIIINFILRILLFNLGAVLRNEN